MLRFLPVFLLAGFVLEIASIIWVGDALGVIATLLLLLAGGILGVSLFKSAGVNAAQVLRSPVQDPSLHRGLAGDTLVRVGAGLLFMVPGFFSDGLALLLFLPPVRRWLRARMNVEQFTTGAGRTGPSRQQTTIIDVEAVEIHGEVEPPRRPGDQT
jgi:UPF0716 protein FxsA